MTFILKLLIVPYPPYPPIPLNPAFPDLIANEVLRKVIAKKNLYEVLRKSYI